MCSNLISRLGFALLVALIMMPAAGGSHAETANFLFKFGTSGNGDGQFSFPHGIAVDEAGNIIVSDRNNYRVQVFDGAGNFLFRFGSQGNDDGQFNLPIGVAHGGNQIIVVDTNNSRIQVFDGMGNFLRKFGGSFGSGDGQFQNPQQVATDRGLRIIVADTSNFRIQVFDGLGNFLRKFGSQGSGDGQFNFPHGVAFAPLNSNIIVADSSNHRIQVFDLSGNFLYKFGSQGSGDGQFKRASKLSRQPVGSGVLRQRSSKSGSRGVIGPPEILDAMERRLTSGRVVRRGNSRCPSLHRFGYLQFERSVSRSCQVSTWRRQASPSGAQVAR